MKTINIPKKELAQAFENKCEEFSKLQTENFRLKKNCEYLQKQWEKEERASRIYLNELKNLRKKHGEIK